MSNSESRLEGERSVALALDVLGTQALVTALTATGSANCVAGVATHADLAVEQASFCFGESCHGVATKSPYLIATYRIGYLQSPCDHAPP